MAVDIRFEQWLGRCEVYLREIALAALDIPLSEAREARLNEVLERVSSECSVLALADLQELIDTVPSDQQTAMRRLRAWGVTLHVQRAILPHRRALQVRQRNLTFRVDDELISVNNSFGVMAAESRRDRRSAIERASAAQLSTLDEYFEAQIEAARNAAIGLGYQSLDHLWSDSTGVDYEAQQEMVTELLAETQVTYVELLDWAVKRCLNVPLAQVRRHDVLTLFNLPDYQKYYQPGFLVPSLQAGLQDMGIDPRADGRLQWRLREPVFGPAEAIALQIPQETVLSYSAVSGLQSSQLLAYAAGQALLVAYTSEALSLPSRLLPDAAISVGNGQLFADMVSDPFWLRYYARLNVDVDYVKWMQLDRLYRFRRQLGRFLFARHIGTSESISDVSEVYRDIMMEACQIDYAPAYYLMDWDWQYTSLTVCRGWALAYVLLDRLRDQFAYDWFRNPDSGEWLLQYWSEAFAHRFDDVLTGLHGGEWEVSVLAEALCQERIG